MNAVVIEAALSDLALDPFAASEFPFQFLAAFGNKEVALKKLRTGHSNTSDVPSGVLLAQLRVALPYNLAHAHLREVLRNDVFLVKQALLQGTLVLQEVRHHFVGVFLANAGGRLGRRQRRRTAHQGADSPQRPSTEE
jgi:hypothetical protein